MVGAMRATDRHRERTVARLGEGYAAGAIGPDTLGFRVDAAYAARSEGDLRGLVVDLPLRGLWGRLRALAGMAPPARVAVRSVRVGAPPDGPGPWTIGRSDRCRLVIDARTVSRAHAELRRTPAGLEIRDLGSTNGTRVNGWRVERALVRPGDELRLGDVRVLLDDEPSGG
jgi:hypothetical protein